MSNRSDDSLDPLFHYEPSRIDAEARGAMDSSEASASPSRSHRPSDEASNDENPSDVGSPDGEPSVSTSRPQDPAPNEGINRAALKAEEEAFPFDLFEAKLELECLLASRGAFTSGRTPRVKRQKPDPPGSSLCSLESLEVLRHRFGISEAVEFVVLEKSDRPDNPPENHFTLYEAFFELCFLWFPIPGVILEYLWKHGISIGQIMPRGLRHMIGILVRSFECGLDIELNHLLNLLEIRKAPKRNRFYISNKAKRRIIGGFPSKDQLWTERFFYVLVNEVSVGEDYVCRTKTAWGPLVRCYLPPIPDDLFTVRDSLSARKVNWRKNFTLERVEKARAILAGVPVSSSSSSSSRDTREKMVILTLRERKRREQEEAARRAAEAARAQAEVVPAQAEVVSAQAEATPQTDPPNWDETTRAAEGNTTEVVERDVAPEVEQGEIVPEASGGDSAVRNKEPSNSAILALPKSTRPPTSVVQKHDPSRKRSAAAKGKGVAVERDEPSKKRRKPTSGESAARKLVVDDPDASAIIFSRGEIVPEASGGDSAVRNKEPSNSAILALPKSTRPPTSVVQKHDPSRKRSAAAKGKGVAVERDEPSKKRRKPTSGESAARKLVVDDPDASAIIFSRVNNANTRLPPPEKLRRPRSYGAMAQRGTKVHSILLSFAFVNFR
ncbi:uncharacterized protein At3g60930, chloroplastic-like [Eutrema salsugineum]|uniref:uncharacterized protein At3g60930, chloroplastic-like n=1 Tax=Eutrema salsugineum TaxID=72664 RepID=UPI000CED7224|nr:uncharacterized protein At3g60930, chloroplastic-like [Eutrema salsugineum]